MRWLANVKTSEAFVRRCSFSPSVSFWFRFETYRMADEWVNQSLQIAFIRPLKLWRAQVVASGTPHCTIRGRFSRWNLGLLWLRLVIPVLSWNWSPGSQLWLGYDQHARHVRARVVGDFEDRIFDPSREMGKSTSWRWDDHGLSCRKECGRTGPDQRPSPQPDPVPEPWLVHWGDGVVVGPASNGTKPTHRHPPWHRHRRTAGWWARAAGPSPDITRTLCSEDGDGRVHAPLRRTRCCTPPRKNLSWKSHEKRIAEPGRAAEKWVPATPPCTTILRGVAVHHPGTLWM